MSRPQEAALKPCACEVFCESQKGTVCMLEPKFQIVTGKPFRTLCSHCFVKHWAGDGYRMFANVNGPAFCDYYCEPCKSVREQVAK